MGKSIWSANLSERTRNLLRRNGIDTVEKLRRLASSGKLRSIYGLGVNTEAEIVDFFEREKQSSAEVIKK